MVDGKRDLEKENWKDTKKLLKVETGSNY